MLAPVSLRHPNCPMYGLPFNRRQVHAVEDGQGFKLVAERPLTPNSGLHESV